MILEQRWTAVPAEQYARESELVGDPDRFDAIEESPSEGLVRPASGSGQDLLDLLEQEQAADRAEPLWHGVDQMTADGGAVRIRFADRAIPQLLPVADTDVEVACHLHHDPKSPSA
jgi:hypothetical protein